MKLAVLSESSADEAAIRILADGLLGRPSERADLPELRHRGWPSVRGVLPAVIKNLHYGYFADALVVVVDSDHTPPHRRDHDASSPIAQKCRLCQLQKTVDETMQKLKPIKNRTPLRIGLGLAMPSLEAWLRCGHDPQVTEAAWIVALQSLKFPYDVRRLKTAIYGTDSPHLQLETECMEREALRLVQDIENLQNWFPNGFGVLADTVRSW
jgi:hypothetical protein